MPESAPIPRRLLTPAEVADVLAVGERTVRRLCAAGELPAVRVRHQWRIRPEGLDAYLEAASPSPRRLTPRESMSPATMSWACKRSAMLEEAE